MTPLMVSVMATPVAQAHGTTTVAVASAGTVTFSVASPVTASKSQLTRHSPVADCKVSCSAPSLASPLGSSDSYS